MRCAYCSGEMDEDDLDDGEETSVGPMHGSCFIDWRDEQDL